MASLFFLDLVDKKWDMFRSEPENRRPLPHLAVLASNLLKNNILVPLRRDPDYGHPVMLLIINDLRFSRISILPTLLWTPGNAEIPASAGRTGRHKLDWCKLGHDLVLPRMDFTNLRCYSFTFGSIFHPD